MSGPFGSAQWMYSSGDFYEFPIEQSLKFNDSDNSYLSKSFATTGTDRKKFTFSCWYKKTQAGAGLANQLINNFNGSAEYGQIAIDANDRLEVYSRPPSNVTHTSLITSARLRDPSAWYHIFVSIDSTQATASDRVKIYINGVLQTAFDSSLTPAQNTEMNYFVAGRPIAIGRRADGGDSSQNLDGYLAEVNLIDGQGLSVTDFGEFKSGVWIPKDPSGITYGTNGFRLSFQNDTVSEGFNTVLYDGNGGTQSINGVGFAPDLVWTKVRNVSDFNKVYDTVRGAGKTLFPNTTDNEFSEPTALVSFNSDGFTVGAESGTNGSGRDFVAWCWDAGSGSPVSNTNGSITSTVKANAAYGMSIVTWTGTGSSSTVGHGLSSTPELIINKNRSAVENWVVYNPAQPNGTQYLRLNQNTALTTDSSVFGAAPTSSVFTVGTNPEGNGNGNNHVAYCFHSVTGYSKVGSYSGSGATGNAITTGFKPAFVMIKRSNNVGNWVMWDNTRDTTNPNQYPLYPNLSNAESFEPTDRNIQFDSNGFTLLDGNNDHNASGGTYIYIAFADTRDNAFWRDQSGNGNDWQPNNLTYQDSLPDSTTNNFATLNALGIGADATVAEGNLQVSYGGSSTRSPTGSTMGVTSGKWYWEVAVTAASTSPCSCMVGLGESAYGPDMGNFLGSNGNVTSWAYSGEDGQKYTAGGATAYGATFASGDIVGVAFDADAGSLTFYKNGVSQGTAFTGLTGATYFPAIGDASGVKTFTAVSNFGQDSSFAGNKPAQGNTDDNGVGDFYYAPPSGYLALCSENLPNPTIDPAKDDSPEDYFGTKLYTGNGGNLSITGLGFQPDFVWGKIRSTSSNHRLHDVVRGSDNTLAGNLTDAEISGNGIVSFDSDGWTMDSGTNINQTFSYVAWAWKAGNGTSSNTDGSITSTVSVNEKAGFSIVGYTGTGANATVGHGIGSAPSMVIIKDRDNGTKNWTCYHKSMGNDRSIFLNLNNAQTASTDHWQYTDPSSSVVYIGDYSHINTSGNNYIAYCFAEVEGYSKFGSYTGNGSSDGPFVYTGFRPAWILTKDTTSTEQWYLIDSSRDSYNVANKIIHPNLSSAEATNNNGARDMLSNGFKVRSADPAINGSGRTYIYMAFAESPFKYSNAR